MKTKKIVYWISTILFSLLMLFSAFMYLTSEEMKNNFIKLGFPSFFRIELGVAKGLGALALAIPLIPARVKEWAYAGFFINLISAIILHFSIDDAKGSIPIFVISGVLVTSYITFHQLQKTNS